jgi:hypothetical protein
VRAVNLIPPESRRGGEGPGRAGLGVYTLLGALAFLVLAVGLLVFTSNAVNDNKTKLAEVTQRAAQTEAEAAQLRAYYDFAQMRERRVATVSALAANRFDWERALRQTAKVLPENVMLTKFLGTVAPGVTVEGVSIQDPAGVRQQGPTPAFQLVGCTDEQADVARIMSRLRRMTGVRHVTLSLSEKPKQEQATNPTELSSDPDCRFAFSMPRFTITVFFAPLPVGPALAPAPTAPGAPPAGQPAATPVANPEAQR